MKRLSFLKKRKPIFLNLIRNKCMTTFWYLHPKKNLYFRSSISKLLKVMKLFCVLISLTTSIVLADSSNAQSVRLFLNLTDVTVAEALEAIEKDASCHFFYNNALIDMNRKISVKAENKDVFGVLDMIFKESDVQYKVVDRDIILTVAKPLLQNEIPVTGTVIDETGVPMSGVNILVKGTVNGVVSDANGRFTVNVPDNASVLVFSFIGYAAQEITVGERRIIDVDLREDTRQIDEVVVVGYGTMRKSDVTGAVLSVSSEKLNERPVSNAFEALQGKAAGVDITNSARPGELGSVRIRGERSITAGSNPLYVVDGIPVQGRENINMLNTYDIKSIDILKDASATSIYGSRGANGVILISTNKGEAGRFSVTYNGSVTVDRIQDSRDRYSAGEWIDYIRWAKYYESLDKTPNSLLPRGDQPTIVNDPVLFGMEPNAWANVMKGWEGGTWNGQNVETTDWTKFVIQTGVTQNHTLSISGGSERMRSYVSMGYLDQKGTSQGQGYQRFSLNASNTLTPFKWFEAGANVNAAWQVQDYGNTGVNANIYSGTGNIYDAAVRLYPYGVPFDEQGNRIRNPAGEDRIFTVVDEWKYSTNQRQTLNVFGNMYARIQLPLKGLSYRTEFGPSLRIRRNGTYIDPESASRLITQNGMGLYNQRDFSWTVNNLINYNNSFGKHRFDATIGQTASYNEQASDNISGLDSPVGAALWHDLGSVPQANITVGSSISEEQLASFMFRLN
jgi:TonB-linked SusC/RagA family outer membrane protein